VLWDIHKSENGPEGWARYLTIIPTHWYVYSLGSTVEYSFTNLEKGIDNQGAGWGHVGKNWGEAFPAGHVWTQGISPANTSQVNLLLLDQLRSSHLLLNNSNFQVQLVA
jgi:hypothetical protein